MSKKWSFYSFKDNFKYPPDNTTYIPFNHSKQLSKRNFIQPCWLWGRDAKTCGASSHFASVCKEGRTNRMWTMGRIMGLVKLRVTV